MNTGVLNDIIKDITVYQKNERNLQTVVYSRAVSYTAVPEPETDTLQNLTGFTAKMRVRSSEAATTNLFELTGTISTPANGTINFDVSSLNNTIADGIYYYEIVIYKTSNDDFATVNKGKYIVKKSLFYV